MKREVPRDEFLRKRAERQRKIRKRRLKLMLLLFVVAALCTGVVLSLTVLFPIKDITATGSKIYTEKEIIEHSGIYPEDNLFRISENKTEKALKSKLPYVESVTLERTVPDKITIKVKDAVEFACYEVDGKYYKVSSSGWVLSQETEVSESLLNIKADKVKCKVGSEITFENEETVELLKSMTDGMEQNKISVQKIDITNTVKIILYVDNRFEVDLGTPNYITEKINHLGVMVTEISPEKSGKIDLSMWTNDNKIAPFRQGN